MDLRNEYEKVELMVDSLGDLIDGQHYEAASLVKNRLVKAVSDFKAKLPGAPVVEAKPEEVCPIVQKEADLPLVVASPQPKLEAPPVTPPTV